MPKFEHLYEQVSALLQRADANMGSLSPLGRAGNTEYVEQTVENMREEFADRFQAIEAQLALLGQNLD
eukprot:6769944-Pyramimonas_sp.AAC.1